VIEYTTCEKAKRDHNWYRWYWSRKNSRYQRECSTMGCDTFQYLKGELVASEPIVLTTPGQEHVHDWGHWGPVEEFQVKENRFYDRRCRTCSAVEETGWVRELGEAVFFPWQEAR